LLAADFFTRRGATIVGRNRRVGLSELDLLVRMGNVTSVVEVKTVSRTAGGISAAAHITGPKLKRLRTMARELGAARVDLLAVTVDENQVELRWVPGVG
jgi:Holliday junction resolvase-like predicted endonuclease